MIQGGAATSMTMSTELHEFAFGLLGAPRLTTGSRRARSRRGGGLRPAWRREEGSTDARSSHVSENPISNSAFDDTRQLARLRFKESTSETVLLGLVRHASWAAVDVCEVWACEGTRASCQ